MTDGRLYTKVALIGSSIVPSFQLFEDDNHSNGSEINQLEAVHSIWIANRRRCHRRSKKTGRSNTNVSLRRTPADSRSGWRSLGRGRSCSTRSNVTQQEHKRHDIRSRRTSKTKNDHSVKRKNPFRNCAPIAALLSEVQTDECEGVSVGNIENSEGIKIVSPNAGVLGGGTADDDRVQEKIDRSVSCLKSHLKEFRALLGSDKTLMMDNVEDFGSGIHAVLKDAMCGTPDDVTDFEKYCPPGPSISKARDFILSNKKQFDEFPRSLNHEAFLMAFDRESFKLHHDDWFVFPYHDLINLSKMSDGDRKKMNPTEKYSYFLMYKQLCIQYKIYKLILEPFPNDPEIFGVLMLIELWRPLLNFLDFCSEGICSGQLDREEPNLQQMSMAAAMKDYLTTDKPRSENAQLMENMFEQCIGSSNSSLMASPNVPWKHTRPGFKEYVGCPLTYDEIRIMLARVCTDIRFDRKNQDLLKHARRKLVKLFKRRWNLNETEAQTPTATAEVQSLQSLSLSANPQIFATVHKGSPTTATIAKEASSKQH